MLPLSQQFHITFLAGGQCNEVKTTCPGLSAAASVVASLSWGRAVLSHSSREQDSGPRSYIQAADYTTLLHSPQVNFVIKCAVSLSSWYILALWKNN